MKLVRSAIMYLVNRTKWCHKHPLTQWNEEERKGSRVAVRYMPFFDDEIQTGSDWIYKQLPKWTPCNFLLHHWRGHDDGPYMHDHPRWSITICLKGQLTEKTPWGEKALKPGNIVFRSTKYIHGFRVEPEHSCRTWTLFIVGRRKRPQNTYKVQRRTQMPVRTNPINN